MNSLTLLMLAWSSGPFTAVPITDAVLESQRGGFRLPSGIDVAIAVDTQTAVNGAVVLRTAFRADQGTPTVTVYVPKDGQVVPVASRAAGSGGGASSVPTISYDYRHGIEVTDKWQGPANVNLNGGGGNSVPDGLQAVSPAGGVTTAAGTVSTGKLGSADAVTLTSSDLGITHLTGGAFGSAIVNSGNDRAIDTETTMSIALSNATPENLGSAMFRVSDVAESATQARMN